MSVTLVTGGAGFVGKHLVQKLIARGENVRVFDLAASDDANIKSGSVTDPDAVSEAMRGVGSVFHLAGNAQLWARGARAFDSVNFKGTRNVVEAARRAKVDNFVHCSSLTTLVGVKAPIGSSKVDEKTRLSSADMLGPYPRSKLLAEQVVEQAAADGLRAMIAIPTEPLGPGDDSLTPPSRMIVDFANGKTPAFIDCVLNFVPVESLADGLIAARDHGAAGERYLLGGENITMRSLLGSLEKLTGRKMPKTKVPYWAALAAGFLDTHLASRITQKPPKAPLTGVRLAGRQISFSSEKAARDLGWRASAFEPALRETIKWYEERGVISAQ